VNLGAFVLLGLVQGVTEFLPVSSSGHLVIFRQLLGMDSPGLAVALAAHAGTLGAVLAEYGRDAVAVAGAFLAGLAAAPRRGDPGFRVAVALLIASVPAAVAGFLVERRVEALFEDAALAGAGLLVTGAVLYLAGTRIRPPAAMTRVDGMGAGKALFVGLAQALAIAPGVSRSGLTIAAGLACGLRGDEAARFSFLLSIPVTIGAVAVGVMDTWNGGALSGGPVLPALVVALVSLVSGVTAIRYLVARLRRGGLTPFAYYCWALGAVVLLVARGL
jgi:undecaprenyl-diphosphatase